MSIDDEEYKDEQPEPQPAARRKIAPEDKAALSWLSRWLGIPFLIVIAIFYAEFLFGGGRHVEVVDNVLKQVVTDDYPFPPGTVPPATLAPPPIIRERPVVPPPATAPTLSGAEIAAHPIEQPQPVYPQRALEAEKEGTVRMRITIGPDGSVIDAVVVSAHPSGWFESAALSAVKRWRYQPSGRTIATDVEIEFKMK